MDFRIMISMIFLFSALLLIVDVTDGHKHKRLKGHRKGAKHSSSSSEEDGGPYYLSHGGRPEVPSYGNQNGKGYEGGPVAGGYDKGQVGGYDKGNDGGHIGGGYDKGKGAGGDLGDGYDGEHTGGGYDKGGYDKEYDSDPKEPYYGDGDIDFRIPLRRH